MTGLPTTTVKLDDGTGTYPTNVSSRVRLVDSIGVASYGRADESPAAQAATLTVVLDNTDGTLTTGAGALTVGQGIRWTSTVGATTRNRFTGRITAVGQGWPGGGDTYSTVTVTAVDILATLARHSLRSMLEEEFLLRNPSAYYTLSEAEGSTSAGDTSGNQALPLGLVGTGTAMSFGTGTGPGTDGLTAAQFFGGQCLSALVAPATAARSVGAWFTTTVAPGAGSSAVVFDQGAGSASGLRAGITSSGQMNASGAVVTDGLTHFVLMTYDGLGGNMAYYLDGVFVSFTARLGTDAGFSVGGSTTDPTAVPFTGTISHVATWPTQLSAGDALAIYQSGVGISESTQNRFSRIAGYAGFSTISTPNNSGQLMGAQATSGGSTLDALNAVAAAEGGVMFANGSGTLVLQGRHYRGLKTSADQTLTAQDLGLDTVLALDSQQVVNKVTVTRTGGAQQLVENTASITAYDVYAQSLDLAVATDDDAAYAAQWLVNRHGTPSPRLPSVTIDLLTSSVAEQLLQRDVGDRLSFSSMPSQLWVTAGDVTIEGWTESLSTDSWTLTLNLLPWAGLFSVFILDSATSGVLDSATPIGY